MKFLDSLRIGLFIVGTGTILLIVARNTIAWYAKQFWGASGNFWQAVFDNIYMAFGGTDRSAGLIGSFLMANLLYWGLSFVYMYFDVYGQPSFLKKYKIQPGKNEPVDRSALIKAIKVVAFNQFVVYGLFWAVVYKLMKLRGCAFSGPISTFQQIIFEMIVFLIFEEIGFYYSHRTLHSKPLYKLIHKRHHEWTAPIALISVYAHPFEHVVANLLPGAIGPLLCGSHLATMWLWQTLIITTTINSHCGYHLPFLPSPEAHDFHHLKFTNNFGVMGVLDRLHGTDDKFRKSPAYDRHIMMLTLRPPREVFPDVGEAVSKEQSEQSARSNPEQTMHVTDSLETRRF